MMLGSGLLVLVLFGGLLIALLGGGAALLSKASGMDLSGRSGEKEQATARQVLDERLARGEIGTEEYEELRARIEQ